MAVMSHGRYYAGIIAMPGQPAELMAELPDVRDDGWFGRMYCKHCYTEVWTVSSYEHFPPCSPSVQALCTDCEEAAA